MTAHIFDLATADGRRLSPYCWAAKLALAQKGLAFETTPTRFIDIPAIHGGGYKTVPVIDLGPTTIGDSFDLALHLEEAHPEAKPLFAGPGAAALTRFVAGHMAYAMGKIARVIAVDINAALDEETQAYFRPSREKMFKASLEDAAPDRDAGIAAAREAFTPLMIMLRKQPYLGGGEPLFADFLMAGVVQWTRVVGTVDFFGQDAPVAEWFGRIEQAHPGVLGRIRG
jgi:glutathione S-transferase